jgi:predicted ester cyclase
VRHVRRRRITAEDFIASGDRVVARVRFTAIELGDLHGLPPPARCVEASHVHIWRVAEGRLAEHWLVQNDLTPVRDLNGR